MALVRMAMLVVVIVSMVMMVIVIVVVVVSVRMGVMTVLIGELFHCRRYRHGRRRLWVELLPKQQHHHRPEQREQRNQPNLIEKAHTTSPRGGRQTTQSARRLTTSIDRFHPPEPF